MLSERIYSLRRKNGLSQEQLAEKIGVSRQAISKWEGGQSTPELDKMKALCECFHLSLDELVGEIPPLKEPEQQPDKKSKIESMAGVILCMVGAVLLVLAGAIMLFSPKTAKQINTASAITLNGSGILLMLCVAVMVVGMVLIFKKK